MHFQLRKILAFFLMISYLAINIAVAMYDADCVRGRCRMDCPIGWCYTLNPKHPNDWPVNCTTTADCDDTWLCPEEEACWPPLPHKNVILVP